MKNSKILKFILIKNIFGLFFALVIFSASVFSQVGNLRITVSGSNLPPTVQAEQRGQRVFLPVVPIARELGLVVNVNNSTETVRVRRVGIEAEFIKQTAEVRENGVTIAAVPYAGEVFFVPNPEMLLLPIEVVAPLLNVSISVEQDKSLVRIESRDTASSVSTRARSKFEVGTLNYNYTSNLASGSYYQNLNLFSTGRIGSSTYQSTSSFIGGSSGSIIGFYGGNFTLNRERGDEFQVGDLVSSVGSELSFLNTLVRGGSYSRPIFGERGKMNFYGGRSFSGISNNLTRTSQSLEFDTNIVGGRFVYEPYKTKKNSQNYKSLTFSAGAVGFSGEKNRGILTNYNARYTTDKLNLEAEVGLGSFNIETFGTRKIEGFGAALIFNGSYRPWRFLTLQGRYDYYGPNFSNPTRSTSFSNRTTRSVGFNLQPIKTMSFGATFSESESKNPILFNNVIIDKYKTTSYGFNFAYDPPTKFLPRLSVNANIIENPFFGNLTIIYANLSREYKNVRPFANYILTKNGDNIGHGLSFGASIDAKRYGQFQAQQTLSFNDSPLLRQDMQCQISPSLCPTVANSQLRLNNSTGSVDWNPNRLFLNRFQFTVGGGYVSDTKGIKPILRSNVGVRLPFEQNLQVSFFRTDNGSEFRFSLSGPLTFWKPRRLLKEGTISNEALLLESTIEGRVFQDENGNRQYEPGIDTAMPNVRVRLNNGIEKVSDVNGLYYFDRMQPGEHHISLNIEDVRANLVPANGLDQTVTVLPRSVVSLPFRMVKAGTLSGRVWFDENGNGKFDEKEGLGDIHIISSSGRDTYSDPDGSFLLSELPPGEQTVFIDERYVPEDLTGSVLSLRAAIFSGKETKDLGFVFKVKPRGVKEKVFASTPVK